MGLSQTGPFNLAFASQLFTKQKVIAATFDLSPQLVITKVRPLATAPIAKKAGNKSKTGRADLVFENPRRTS